MTKQRLRIVFAGTPEIAADILASIIDKDEHDVALVLTQPDRPAGRGRKLKFPAVKDYALERDLPIKQPEDKHALELISLSEYDLLLVIAFGLVVTDLTLQSPRLGCINIHTSLLPRWRGAAPIQRAVEAGDKETGISFMQMDTGLDTGPILMQVTCSVSPNETGGSLHDKLCRLACDSVHDLLNNIAGGKLDVTPQKENSCTYAKKITKAEAQLDWKRSAKELERQIRAFNPFPICFATINSQDMRIWEATEKHYSGKEAVGTAINHEHKAINVVTADGLLSITRVQLPGKQPVAVADFLRGRQDFFQSVN